jgi:hypothetical protein
MTSFAPADPPKNVLVLYLASVVGFCSRSFSVNSNTVPGVLLLPHRPIPVLLFPGRGSANQSANTAKV